jgi:hypothetical protein
MARLAETPATKVLTLVTWLICAAAGAYLAAGVAGRAEVRHGALSARMAVTLAILSLAAADSKGTALLGALPWLLTPIPGALGGYLRGLQVGGGDLETV